MQFYYVYILQSLHDDFLYVGFTKDLKQRFQDHNGKKELSTKKFAPFTLIHYEAYRNEKDAKRREEYFKTTKGKTTLKYMLRDYLNSAFPLQKINPLKNKKPGNAVLCPVCGGQKEAPTKSFFTRSGQRTSGMTAICLTCKGKGWITQTNPNSNIDTY